jgi:NCS2 family nucleobase:cation symporter-2
LCVFPGLKVTRAASTAEAVRGVDIMIPGCDSSARPPAASPAARISLTGVASRFVVAFGGVFLVMMALVPKIAAAIALMPSGVLGGVLVFMFATVASVGVDILSRSIGGRREPLILSASLAVGLGIQAAPPGAFDAVPQAIRIVVSDGIVVGILMAMGLNLLMPQSEGLKTEDKALAH